MKTAARIISFLFHPLLFPIYGSTFILFCNPNRFGVFGNRVQMAWLIIVFALTFVFPVIWLLMMRRLEMIQSLALETSRERIIPFIATATFYLWATWMFKPAVNMKIPSNELLFYMMAGASLSVFAAFVINIFSKISLHTLAAGSMIAICLTMIRYSTYDLRIVFLGILILSGAIGASRLLIKAHSEQEVLTGYLTGFTCQFIAFSLISRLF
ncbi:MAG: hypothetical protein IPP77_08775 [Bacteroidetes bacterium]|nr:hypothetical protein [Bacteroidota bacterium]